MNTPEHEQVPAPGSATEREMLTQQRAINRNTLKAIGGRAMDMLIESAGPDRVVTPEVSRQAHHAAIQQITEEQRIPIAHA